MVYVCELSRDDVHGPGERAVGHDGDMSCRIFVLQKSKGLPLYDENIEERGFDNVEYTEKIRNASGGRRGMRA